ncbi:PLP-dependent aminotransferase family protein [Streptomyces sp. AC536]|uniref:aminotransferase-like domain-containing protein n=1 Tax=Streptomyces buecherae TaxID=2763006 RepID=UPI00164DF781|nr:PLP-dependent aminotransferase family protein [Streptomyces buecherae]MBC3984480.1 PLP-dependent aminotransferase family protein [Streptomyces buecherae]QNJ38721.1 PLP-dependent aminotransferase family protein [Streptomyces buecherae]
MSDSQTTSSPATAHGAPTDHAAPASDAGPNAARAARAATPAWELLLPSVALPARQRGRALQRALRDAITLGRIAGGTRLPASRELAADLGVSRGLITDAYEQLTAEGYLRSGQGAGTWVSGAVRCAAPAGPERTDDAREPAVGFLPGTPDLSLFPRAAWTAAHRRALARLPHEALGYPDPRGLPELREALAGLLTRRRGVVADPERIVVCSGVAQALTLVGAVLAGRGGGPLLPAGAAPAPARGGAGGGGRWAGAAATETVGAVQGRDVAATVVGPARPVVALEDPGTAAYRGLFAAVGVDAVPLAVGAEGIDPAELAATGARGAVLTPSHQFPSGIAYSARRRSGLLDWARAADGLLVEDDYDGDFRYDRAPVGALQGLDPGRVVYTGSVSKSLAPGLRLGWMVVPQPLVDEVVERKRTMDLGHPVLDQALFADLIGRGDYDRQLRRCQRAYRERRDALVTALAEHFPGTRVTGIAAGLHVIAHLPERYGPRESFLARAQRAGVALAPLDAYACGTAPELHARPGVRLVLGYAHLSPSRIVAAVRQLRHPDR